MNISSCLHTRMLRCAILYAVVMGTTGIFLYIQKNKKVLSKIGHFLWEKCATDLSSFFSVISDVQNYDCKTLSAN